MIDWSLDCEYFHVVLTLPHTLNPLIYVNAKLMYQILCRTATQLLSSICKKQFDCASGMVLILHTWGQKMNLHAHVHIIMTAGGLSSDKTKWITIDSSHPAMQNDSLADQFRTRFLRRSAGSWFREKPDASELFARSSGFLQTQLHAPINAIGLGEF